MTKKRILFHGEASYAASGFGKMTYNFMKRFYESGKYEVAELANFGHYNQVDRTKTPWRFYSVLPDEGEAQEFDSCWDNKFGKWRFDEVVLDFKPDYVICIADYWMVTSAFNSPLRKYYKLGYISCVDSSPIKQDWLSMMEEADDLFGYTDWGLDVIRDQSNIGNVRCATPPGADFNIFKPSPNKAELRASAGLEPELLIAGMIARNQKRKLFPDLFASFRMFLDKYSKIDKELTDRCRLYIHTSFPDMGYDIPRLINRYGLSNRVLCTYLCRHCKKTNVSYFRDARTVCNNCRQGACVMPRVDSGVSENTLSEIMNLFDVYIQVCTNEGLGMPQVESAACSTYIMATDYSATSDVVEKTGGRPLRVTQLFSEVETQADKAVPDNEYAADCFYEFFSLPEKDRKNLGFKARMGAIKHYNYDKSAKLLLEQIDKVDLDPARWSEPAKVFEPVLNIPQMSSVYDFVGWAIVNILNMPEKVNSPFHKKMSRELTTTFRYSGNGTNFYVPDNSVLVGINSPQDFNPNIFIGELVELRKQMNYWEQRRTGQIQVPRRPYLDKALAS